MTAPRVGVPWAQGELDGAARRMEQSSEDGRALRERLSRVEQERAELEREVHDAGKRLQERERRAAEREAQLLAAEEALRGQLGAGGEELAVLKAELEGRTAEHQGALTQVRRASREGVRGRGWPKRVRQNGARPCALLSVRRWRSCSRTWRRSGAGAPAPSSLQRRSRPTWRPEARSWRPCSQSCGRRGPRAPT